MHDNSNILLYDQFADFDTSMRLKQLGFEQPCMRYYDKDGRQCQSVCKSQTQYTEQVCSAPLWAQVIPFTNSLSKEVWDELLINIRIRVLEMHSNKID